MSGTIIAIGGLSPNHNDDALHRFVVDAAKLPKPRVCYVPLASGDFERYLDLFYEQYPSTICTPTHLELLRSVSQDPADVLSSQDIVYLGGGSTPVLVAALRILGLAEVLQDVLDRGGVVGGDSAGAHALFRGCITDSLGPYLRVFSDGLGIIHGTCVAHADEQRHSILQAALKSGKLMGPAWAIEDGAAVSFTGRTIQAVTSRPQACVTVFTTRAGEVEADPLEVTPL